jgi:hypothetical protein
MYRPLSAPVAAPARSGVVLARIALAGPLVFTLVVALLDVLQYPFLVADGASPLTQSPVSENALGPYGALQCVAFALLGLAVLALAAGLYRAAATNFWARIGIGFVVIFGLAFLASAFPTDHFNAGKGDVHTETWHGAIHSVAFYVMALSQIPAYLLTGIGLRKQVAWRGVSRYSMIAGVLVFPSLALAIGLPPVFSWFYVWLAVVPFAWMLVMVRRLTAVSGAPGVA